MIIVEFIQSRHKYRHQGRKPFVTMIVFLGQLADNYHMLHGEAF